MSTFLGLVCIFGLLLFAGIALARLAKPAVGKDADPDTTLIESVNAVLPQTQCAQCGYPGCRPYAEAIIKQHESINRCPPGGDTTVQQLANMLGTKALPLDTSCGDEKPKQVAVIDEAVCIGCTLCIVACPVDAIVGAAKQMHTVIGHDCTGCELCLPPCPVDCIELVSPENGIADWHWPKPA